MADSGVGEERAKTTRLLWLSPRMWFDALSLIIGILGLGSGYYFYLAALEERAPIFLIEPIRTRLVDASALDTPSISVLGPEKAPITGNVSSLRFYFWNNGRKAIKTEHILSPLAFAFEDTTVRILDARILAVSRSKIVKPELIKTKAEQDKDVLQLAFAIMEQNDGVATQVIFNGQPNAKFVRESGDIEGAKIGDNSAVEAQQNRRFYGFIAIILIQFALIAALFVWLLVGVVPQLYRVAEANQERQSQDQKIKYYASKVGSIMIPTFVIGSMLLLFAVGLYLDMTKKAPESKEEAKTTAIFSVPKAIRPQL